MNIGIISHSSQECQAGGLPAQDGQGGGGRRTSTLTPSGEGAEEDLAVDQEEAERALLDVYVAYVGGSRTVEGADSLTEDVWLEVHARTHEVLVAKLPMDGEVSMTPYGSVSEWATEIYTTEFHAQVLRDILTSMIMDLWSRRLSTRELASLGAEGRTFVLDAVTQKVFGTCNLSGFRVPSGRTLHASAWSFLCTIVSRRVRDYYGHAGVRKRWRDRLEERLR